MPPSLHTLHEYMHSAMFSHHRALSLLAGLDLHPVLDLGLYISSLYISSLDLGLYLHPVLDPDLHPSMFFLDDLKYIQGLHLVPTMIERLSDFYIRLGV